MEPQHLKLFEQALKLVAKEFQESKLTLKRQDSVESDTHANSGRGE